MLCLQLALTLLSLTSKSSLSELNWSFSLERHPSRWRIWSKYLHSSSLKNTGKIFFF